jgi:GTP-binding protein HflX
MDDSSKLIDIEQPPLTETAILVRLALPYDSEDEVKESLEEMEQLAWTAGARVAATFVQYRPKPDPGTLIGRGKAADIKAACEELDVDVVIVDSDLTPAQGSNLSKLLDVKVVDRTQLILDIFAQRAHTNEGKHQVELAQLQYLLPRLAGRGAVMRQQGGIGVRGPGEQKLEVDRRVIRRRIQRLKDEIEATRLHRAVRRKRRVEGAVGSVALVGYTNAGKSSLLNAIAGSDVFVENKLFATLDPRSRSVTLPSQRQVVFSDTVGFIRKLPHSLVAAFRATLEEVNHADLLLLVADAAHPAVEDQIDAARSVLSEIDADDRASLYVFNKIDIANPARVEQLLSTRSYHPAIAVSAWTGANLEALVEAIDRGLASNRSRVFLRIPQNQAGAAARVHEAGRVLSEEYQDNAILMEAEVDPALRAKLSPFIVEPGG